MERIVRGKTPKDVSGDGERRRRTYEPPKILRRQQVVASTLVSGEQCVFDPPGSPGCP